MTATSSLTKPKDGLKTLLADCASLKTFLGVENATAAKAKIYTYESAIDETSSPWPLAVIKRGRCTDNRDSIGGGIANFANEISYTVFFEKKLTKSGTNQEAFENSLGDIRDDLEDLSDTPNGYVLINSIDIMPEGDGEYYDENKGLYVGTFVIGLRGK